MEITDDVEWNGFSAAMGQSLIGMSLRKSGREIGHSEYQRLLKEFCWKGEKNGQAWERKRRSFEILQEKDLIFRGKK